MRAPVALLLVLLLAPTLPAAVGPEIPISERRTDEAVDRQSLPAIAERDGCFFAVWVDQRGAYGAGGSVILGSRVDADGNFLDPAGIHIGGDVTKAPVLDAPIVVDAPHGYTVVWKDRTGDLPRVGMRRIDPDGRPLEEQRSIGGSSGPIGGLATNGRSHVLVDADFATVLDDQLAVLRQHSLGSLTRIATDGENYLLIGRNATIRMNVQGEILARSENDFTSIPERLIWTGSDYLAIFRSQQRIDGARFDREGRATTPLFPLLDHDAFVDVTPIGDGAALMIWSPSATDVFAARLEGTTLGTRESVAVSVRQETDPAIATSGNRAVAVWTRGRTFNAAGLDAAALSASGARLDGRDPKELRREKVSSVTAQYDFATLRGTPSTLAVWAEEGREDMPQIMIRDLAKADEPRALAPVFRPQFLPSLATNGENILAVWNEGLELGAGDVMVMRLALDGTPLEEPRAIAKRMIGEPGDASVHYPAAVAWNGSYYLIAYTTPNGELHLVRMTAGGVLIDDRHIFDQPLRSQTVLVAAGGLTWLIWEDRGIKAARIAPGGIVLDLDPIVVSPFANHALPDAAWDGATLFIVWLDGDAKVLGKRIADAEPIVIGQSLPRRRPSVAAETLGSFVVAWEERLPNHPPSLTRILARRVRGLFAEPAQRVSQDAAEHASPYVWSVFGRQAAIAFNRWMELVPRERYLLFDPVPAPRVRAVR